MIVFAFQTLQDRKYKEKAPNFYGLGAFSLLGGADHGKKAHGGASW